MIPHMVEHSIDAYGDPIRLKMMVDELACEGNAINPRLLGPLYHYDTNVTHWYEPATVKVSCDSGDPCAAFYTVGILCPLSDLVQVLSMHYPEFDWYLWYRSATQGFEGHSVWKAGEMVSAVSTEFVPEPISDTDMAYLKANGYIVEAS